MMWLFLAATVSFTAPRFDAAGPNACEPDSVPIPCSDLNHFEIYGVRHGTTEERFFQAIKGMGREGQLITFTPTPPDHPDDVWSVYVRSVDTSGNMSCRGNVTAINVTAGVPIEGGKVEKEEWFDVLGRKLKKPPTTPGVYYIRRGKTVRPIVVLKLSLIHI